MSEDKKKQVRKAYKKHDEGEQSQKMISFRLDMKVWRWLASKPNKGRYINNLIAKDMKAGWIVDDEHTDELQTKDDYLP